MQTALDASVADGPSSAPGDVEGLYATLTGRMTYYSLGEFVNINTKQFQPGISFDLHERLTQSALFVQDSWRALAHADRECRVALGLHRCFHG